MMFRVESAGKGEMAPVQRCTLEYVQKMLKLKASELEQFRALRLGEGLDCGPVKVYRII